MNQNGKEELHRGHRERLKHRYLRDGAASMSEHEVLELLLTYAIPRRDVNPLAHRLINRYGSLESVLFESPMALASNEGVSMHTATLLGIIGDAVKSSLIISQPRMRIANVGEAMEIAARLLRSHGTERALVMLMDSKGLVLDWYFEQGGIGYADIDMRRLLSRALACGAAGVLLAHDHPSGNVTPSAADGATLNRLLAVLAQVDVKLYEQIIVTDDDCYAVLHDLHLEDIAQSERTQTTA